MEERGPYFSILLSYCWCWHVCVNVCVCLCELVTITAFQFTEKIKDTTCVKLKRIEWIRGRHSLGISVCVSVGVGV